MSSASILEPNGQTDTSLKFTAGLIMSVPLEAELNHLLDPSRIRIKVKYPDQKTQIILPRPSHLKPLYYDENNEGKTIADKLKGMNYKCFFFWQRQKSVTICGS